MDMLLKHPWPGNVRELENAIERGVILMRGDHLDERSLPLSLHRAETEPEETPPADAVPSSLEEAEKLVLSRTLEATDGNRSEAARRLNITRKTLLSKINKYGLD